MQLISYYTSTDRWWMGHEIVTKSQKSRNFLRRRRDEGYSGEKDDNKKYEEASRALDRFG
jgi:hypothetical protein